MGAASSRNPAVGNVSRPSPAIALRAFNLMDQWLSAIEADNSNQSHDEKVTRNRPGGGATRARSTA